MPLCEQLISVIMTGDPNLFQPIMAVEVFTKLMNTMIVSLMSGATYVSYPPPALSAIKQAHSDLQFPFL